MLKNFLYRLFLLLFLESSLDTMMINTLLVDDERSLLEQAKIFLERVSQEIEVSTVSSAKKALETIDENNFDVIVSDYQMPEMDGLEFLEEIREKRGWNIPFIMFTGKGREEVAMKALNLGADRYIKKEGNPKDQFEFLAHAINRENKQYKTKREKKEREKKVKKLYEASIEISNYDSEEKVYDHVLDSFKDILDFQASSICMLENENLVVKATTNAKNVEVGQTWSKKEGIRGLTYKNQKSYLIEDLSNWEESQPSDPDVKSGLSVPIKDEGIFQAISYEKNFFDEFDLEMAEMLISFMWQVIEGIRYQNELKKNRIWLNQVIENSSVPTFVIDEEHRVTHWNKGCENLTGIQKNTIIGTKETWKAFYDEERPVLADLVLEGASERTIEKYYDEKFTESAILSCAYETEDFFPKFGDKGIWLYFTAAPIKDAEENKVGAIETLEDITQRKKHEQELKKRNEGIKKLHEKASELKRCKSVEEICDLVVETSEQILNFEVCGIDFVEKGEFVPIAVSSQIEEGFIKRKVGEAGISRKAYEERESILVKDRREVDFSKPVVSDYRASITIPMGDFGIYQALSTKIGGLDEKDLELAEILVNHATEAINRLKSEKQLKKSKEKIEKLHQASAELESCQSEDGVYKCAVKAAENILDFDMCGFDAVESDKFVAKATSSGVPEDGHVDKPIDEAGTSKRTYLNQESYLIEDLTEDKEAKPVKSDYRSIISLPAGEYGIFQAVSTVIGHFDEEDLKIAELLISHVVEALKRLETEKREEFLHSLLRHDVGNKAQITQGYLQLIKDYDLLEEVEEYVEKARQSTVDGIDIIEKVRKLRKIEKKEDISDIDLDSKMNEIISKYKSQLEEKNIILERNEFGREVKGGSLLEELFSNIIENSIRHSNCDKIRIDSQIKEDKFVITVEDDGEGISDDLKEKIFDKGFKSGESAGTGLGLYMVKEIVEGYDGSVEVKDSELGGAGFDVMLKRAEN